MSRRSKKGAHFAKANEKPKGLAITPDEETLDERADLTEPADTNLAESADANLDEPTDTQEESKTEDATQDEQVEKTSVAPSLASILPEIPEADQAEADGEGAAAQAEGVLDETVQAPAAEDLPVISAVSDTPAPKKKRKWVLPVVGTFVVLLAGGYLGGVVGFDRYYFMPNTTLNGQDVSLVPVADVAERYSRSTDDFKLSVSGQGLELSIAAADVNLRDDGDAIVQEALEQVNPWAWPIEITNSRTLTADERIAFDEDLVTKVVTNAVTEANKDATKPTDAKASYDKEKHVYKIDPEKAGTEIDAKVVISHVSDALSVMEPAVELEEDVLVPPSVKADDPKLVSGVEAINKQLGATQKLKVGDHDVFEVGSDLIAGWVKVSEDLTTTVDTEAIVKWAQGDLSKKLDSAGAQRSYTRPDGKSINVTGGSYGWIIDGEALGKQIAENLTSGTGATIDVPMLQTADSWNPGGQDWGKRFIDIDVSEQHVRLYDSGGGLIWESDCVTGNTSEKHDTPQGVYQINSNKETGDVILEGPIDEKTNKPEYVSHVTYWMPFVWNAVALHDATWRYSFGGDIYQTSGSHGCVNLPYDKAAELYNLCEVGDVVIVHW